MNQRPSDSGPLCHQCGSAQLTLANGYAELMRVTSDCKPWGPGGQLGMCRKCGLIQAITRASWELEAEQIYSDYTIYYQSGGIEQSVFTVGSGEGQPRSNAVLTALSTHVGVPQIAVWLDAGCGNGAILKTCSQRLPEWRLFGLEVSDKNRSTVQGIRGVQAFYAGPIERIDRQFDVISMNHVIEHIPGPGGFLRSLTKKLKPGGLI